MLPRALLEARLHHPDLAHVGGQLAAAGDVADARVEDVVDRVLQRRERMLLARQAVGPAVAHVGPQHAGQQEAGRDRLVLATRAGRCPAARRLHERLLGALDHQVQQRIDAASPGPATSSCSIVASEWPVCSSLSISSNRRLCGTSASKVWHSRSGAAVLGSSLNPSGLSLAAKRTARMMRTGSSR